MKEFLVYTGLRDPAVHRAWSASSSASGRLLDGDGRINLLWPVVIAFALSGVASYFLLNRQRDAFARKVEERAARASAAFEERRAREDQD